MKQTIAVSATSLAPLKQLLNDPRRALGGPQKIPEATLQPLHVLRGFLPPPQTFQHTAADTMPHFSEFGLSSGTASAAEIAATQFAAGPSRSSGSGGTLVPILSSQSQPPTIAAQLSTKRVEEQLTSATTITKRPRKTRTCRKCGIPSCKGKRGWTDCENKCRDCGKSGRDLSCKGRNPDYPDRPCDKAPW